jgi:pimeloyl-ACP methyl ester carboxylesterase
MPDCVLFISCLQGFPSWQVMLVDLRCHGESSVASGGMPAVGPHTVQSAAKDVLALLREQRMFPHMLVGHSFGGKVVMSMAQQFGAQLPRPVQVCAGKGLGWCCWCCCVWQQQ